LSRSRVLNIERPVGGVPSTYASGWAQIGWCRPQLTELRFRRSSDFEPRNAKPVRKGPADFARGVRYACGIKKTPPIVQVKSASNRDWPVMPDEFVEPQHARSQVKQVKGDGLSTEIVHKPADGGIFF